MFWTNVSSLLTTIAGVVLGGLLLHALKNFVDLPAQERSLAFDKFMEATLLPGVSVLFIFHVITMEMSTGPATKRDVWVSALLAIDVALAFTIKLVMLLNRRFDRVSEVDKTG